MPDTIREARHRAVTVASGLTLEQAATARYHVMEHRTYETLMEDPSGTDRPVRPIHSQEPKDTESIAR